MIIKSPLDRFDGKVIAFVHDNDINMDALYSKNQNCISLHYLEHTIQLRLKVALDYIPTVSKLHSRFC